MTPIFLRSCVLVGNASGTCATRRLRRFIPALVGNTLNAAIEDGLMAANPAARLGRVLKLTVSKSTVQEEIKAMTQAQRQVFLASAYREATRYYPLFFALAGTGMRLGEGLALQPEDLDCCGKTIRIAAPFPRMGNSTRQNQAMGAQWRCHGFLLTRLPPMR